MTRPLVLTGGPAVGKSTTAQRLGHEQSRAAVIDVDDSRQLVVAGAAVPWNGEEGAAQHRLGVLNACALATRFDVLIADVLTPLTTPL